MSGSPPDYPFEFPSAVTSPGAKTGVIVVMVFQVVYFVLFASLGFKQRHTRVVRVRSFYGMLRTHFLGLLLSLSMLASLLTGKPLWCEAQGYFHNMFLPLCILPFSMAIPEAIMESEVNHRKVARHLGRDNSRIWKVKAALTDTAKFGIQLVALVIQLAVYIPVRYLIPLPGDCVRTSLVVTTAFSFLYMVSLGGFLVRFGRLQDPLYIKLQIRLGFLTMTPYSFVMIIYAIAPQVFSESFDYRIIPVLVHFSGITTGLVYTVLLSYGSVQEAIRRWTSRREAGTRSPQSDRRDPVLFANVLQDPTLLEGFSQFCEQQWCVENILFWKTTEDFISTFRGGDADLQRATHIVDEFILEGAPLQINIDDSLRELITHECEAKTISAELFERAREDVFIMMKQDAFSKWQQTENFQQTLKKADVERPAEDKDAHVVLNGLGAGDQEEMVQLNS